MSHMCEISYVSHGVGDLLIDRRDQRGPSTDLLTYLVTITGDLFVHVHSHTTACYPPQIGDHKLMLAGTPAPGNM